MQQINSTDCEPATWHCLASLEVSVVHSYLNSFSSLPSVSLPHIPTRFPTRITTKCAQYPQQIMAQTTLPPSYQPSKDVAMADILFSEYDIQYSTSDEYYKTVGLLDRYSWDLTLEHEHYTLAQPPIGRWISEPI